jgi:predicted esterase
MLARFFLRKFQVLDPQENYIIAPQGLSKFYNEGFSGRVGASWMTKEDRLTEIENQKKYIDFVLKKELGDLSDKYKIVFLGFSQGVSTACRFLVSSQMECHHLVLWAGSFPPEIERKDTYHWRNMEITYVTGMQDPFLKEGIIEGMLNTVRLATGKNPNKIEFEGKHELDQEVLKNLI